MQASKVKSFTLSEMLVVMVITAIVVGIAFSVLSLIQKQVRGIGKNFSKTTEISLLEQQLWQDFSNCNSIYYTEEKIVLASGPDTITYAFGNDFVLRNTDTIRAKLKIDKAFYKGKMLRLGYIDAVFLSADAELPGHFIFVSSASDATLNMNQDGL